MGTPDYFAASKYSLDMVRMEIKAAPDDLGRIQNLLDTCELIPGPACIEKCTTYTTNKVGGYRFLWQYETKESGLAVGMAHIAGNGKTDAGTGFIEFNPNKVANAAAAIIDRLVMHVRVRFRPVRYDLAIDYPIERDTVRLMKDGRKYSCEISDSMTEYLGQRNKPGRVKVYDKQAESNLLKPVTRVELTCDAEWTVEQVMAQLPRVFDYSADWGDLHLSAANKTLAIAIRALEGYGEVPEPWLRMVSSTVRTRIRRALASGNELRYRPDLIEKIIEQVAAWATGERCSC